MLRHERTGAVILLGGLGGLFVLVTALAEARRELPHIETLADPCTETCAFKLCVVERQLQRCATRCGLRLERRISMPPREFLATVLSVTVRVMLLPASIS